MAGQLFLEKFLLPRLSPWCLLKEQGPRAEAERERARHEEQAHEPTRMDPVLGMTAYLEPDFAALTPMRAFKVPQQLRGPHPAVTAFQEKRQHVSRPQVPRAAPYVHGLVNAVAEMGWSAPAKVQVGYAGRGEPGPDLSIKLPSREFQVAIRELDERGRPGRAFITQTDYLTRTARTTVYKNFTASGRLG